MTLMNQVDLTELAYSLQPLSDVLTPGTCLRHASQRPGWQGGEVVIFAVDETVTLAPYRTRDPNDFSGALVDYSRQAVVLRSALPQYVHVGYLALDDLH